MPTAKKLHWSHIYCTGAFILGGVTTDAILRFVGDMGGAEASSSSIFTSCDIEVFRFEGDFNCFDFDFDKVFRTGAEASSRFVLLKFVGTIL